MADRMRNAASGQFEKTYPFDELKIGDYFIVKLVKNSPEFKTKYSRIRSSAYMYGMRNNSKFKCAQIEQGVKVTRLI